MQSTPNPTPVDVLVVGGGAIGLACALALRDAGRSVRLIEAAHVGAGASHGNCGTITPSHAPPLASPGMVGTALRYMLQPDAPLYIKPRLDPRLWAWLLRFAGRSPDELAGELGRVAEAINDAPLDDLEFEDEAYPPERIAAYETAQIDGGHRLSPPARGAPS